MTQEAYTRIVEAGIALAMDANEQGLWCPSCGDSIAPDFFFEDSEYEPPAVCRQCGYPGAGL